MKCDCCGKGVLVLDREMITDAAATLRIDIDICPDCYSKFHNAALRDPRFERRLDSLAKTRSPVRIADRPA